ncbi:MAG: DUF1015 domain-containing protein [Candidatus Rokubacteria bacterium]|nr:DUF1015 domain-containing protein [Candidatus Rokubacteria bacterium]
MTIKPFRGYRYNPAKVGDLSSVVAPPYDQIGPETQARLHGMSPWSIARITLSRETYAAARSTLDEWLALGIFEQEATPALYPYQQRYTVGGRTVTRTGFIALGEVTDYAEKVVLPHERTHAEPKEDRLRLLAATEADIGLLFMLFDDPGGAIRAATAPGGRPLVEARDLKGEIHRLWRIVDPEAIERAQALMADRRVIIADGHHRYETAVAYRRRRPDARYKLMAFFALDAPGVTILPNHRLVRQVAAFALERLLADAGKWFEVRPLPSPITVEPGTIVVVAGRAPQGAVLRLRPEAAVDIPWPVDTSAAWRRLAVSVLHEGILTPLLGITAEQLDPRTHVGYTAQAEEAVALVREDAYQAAFLIPPVTPEELRAVVAGGELLPPKSTHFYPKLLDGLVFYRLGEE